MTDIVFMDTETLGLHPDAPVWEFAAIRRFEDGSQKDFHCFIDHYPLPWIDSLPDEFAQDYRRRYSPEHAVTQYRAAEIIGEATRGAHVVGAVPNFDTERLQRLLLRAQWGFPGDKQPWHYHLIDVENLVVGWLNGVAARAIDEARIRGDEPDPELVNRRLSLPWKSDEISRAVGVDPDQFERHTAMGDVLWVKAQYDAVIGGAL